jgi:hypothetical protein
VVAVYQRPAQGDEAGAPRVTLAFEGIDGRRVRVVLAGRGPLGSVLLVSNGISECRPYVGSLQALAPRAFANGDAPKAVDASGVPAGAVHALGADIETVVSRQECSLAEPARRYDFSTYGFDLLSGYRFLEGANGRQFVPGDTRLRPVQSYAVRLDNAIEEARFEGGVSVNDHPNARDLTADQSALSARWKDPHLSNLREFALFILAGAFALGISMLIELVKPHFLE